MTLKRLAAASDPLLTEKHRPAAVELDGDRDHRTIGSVKSSSAAAPTQVHRALEQPRGAREHGRVDAEHRQALDVVHLGRRPHALEELRQVADLYAAARGAAEQVEHAGLLSSWRATTIRSTSCGADYRVEVELVHGAEQRQVGPIPPDSDAET